MRPRTKILSIIIIGAMVPVIAWAELQIPGEDILEDTLDEIDVDDKIMEYAEEFFDKIEIEYSDGKFSVDFGELTEIIEDGGTIYELGEEFYGKLQGDKIISMAKDVPGLVAMDPTSENFLQIGDDFFRVEGEQSPSLELILKEYDIPSIIVEKDWYNEALKLKSEGTEVLIQDMLVYRDGNVFLSAEEGWESFVKLLPHEVRDKVQMDVSTIKIQDMELTLEGDRSVYHVSGLKTKKILGIFPIKVKVDIEVGASDEAVETEEEDHWWDFLAF